MVAWKVSAGSHSDEIPNPFEGFHGMIALSRSPVKVETAGGAPVQIQSPGDPASRASGAGEGEDESEFGQAAATRQTDAPVAGSIGEEEGPAAFRRSREAGDGGSAVDQERAALEQGGDAWMILEFRPTKDLWAIGIDQEHAAEQFGLFKPVDPLSCGNDEAGGAVVRMEKAAIAAGHTKIGLHRGGQ